MTKIKTNKHLTLSYKKYLQKPTHVPLIVFIGVFWRDTSQESAWLLETKNFLGFLCAHQNDAL